MSVRSSAFEAGRQARRSWEGEIAVEEKQATEIPSELSGLLVELDTRPATREEARRLLELTLGDPEREPEAWVGASGVAAHPAALDALCAAATRVRNREMAGRDEVEAGLNSVIPCYLRPLCRYCPYWRQPGSRPMPIDELLGYVRYLHDETDVRQFHLSGGSKRGGGDCGIVGIVEAIRAAGYDDMDVVVNCGASMSDADLARLAELRVKRVFSVFETTNPDVFRATKPGDDLDEKLDFARRIAAAGIGVGTGMMAGLGPVASKYDDYVRTLFDIAALPKLEAMYISKFRHAPNIAMNDHPECPLDEARALVAVARLVLCDVHIRAAAGWRPSEREAARDAGVGSLTAGLMFPRPKPGEKGCWGD